MRVGAQRVHPCGKGRRALVISADFYDDIVSDLQKGAWAVLESAGADIESARVLGALELPAALAVAVDNGSYDVFVVLGCIIRGETSHYEIVAAESARGIMDLSIANRLAVGNGILAVENMEQARERADMNRGDKGGFAARAALAMADLRDRMKRAS